MADLSSLDRAIRAARRGHTQAARQLLDGVLASEPQNEHALAWRARIETDAAVKRSLLDRVLALTPDARWAHDEIARLGDVEARAAAPTALGDVGRPAATLHHLQCPNCGGQVEIHPELGTRAVVCTHCQSVLDLTAAQASVIGRIEKKWSPKHDILPGAEGVFEGERHVVSGWLRYKGWDSEESWTWDEWQLISDSGIVRYLSWSSDEGFLLQTPIRPTPKVSRGGVELPDGKVRFHEVSPAKITAMAGELTWRPRLNETLKTGEGTRNGVHYSAELTAAEVEVVAGPTLTDMEVWRALDRRDKLAEAEARQERRRVRRLRARRTAMLWAIGALVFGALGMLSDGWGATLLDESVEVSVAPVTLPAPAYEAALVALDTVAVGTLSLPDQSMVATLTARLPDGVPGGLSADLILRTPDGTPYKLNAPPLDGAPGTEVTASSRRSAFSRRRDVTGPLDVLLIVHRQSWTGNTYAPWPASATVPVTVSIRREWAPGPFWTATVISLFVALVFFVFSRTDP